MMKSLLPLAAASLLLAAGHVAAQTTVVEGTLTDDRYTYWIITDGGTRTESPLFAFVNAPSGPQFFFNYYDSNLTAQWDVEVPGTVTGSYGVTSAVIELYLRPGDSWDPALGEVRLFAAGFTGTNGFTEATWTENMAYVGPTAFAPGLLDPYPVELGTGLRAENNPAAQPWAVGLVGDTSSTDGILVTFTLDTTNPEIQAKLLADLAQGFSSWIVVSTYLAEQPGGTRSGNVYPSAFTKEAVGQPGVPANVAAPSLTLELGDPLTSVQGWQMFQ